MMEYYRGGGDKTIAKLVTLDKYLKAYVDILGKEWNWPDEIWYVDTHAGTGYTVEFDLKIPGSTLRALDHDFDRYYFYELNGDHYQLLCESIEEHQGIALNHDTLTETGHDYAYSNDPDVTVLNMDCNTGVDWLIREKKSSTHWFTFIDPEGLTVKRDLVDSLIERGNTDILYNFQTSGYERAGAENAEHGHEKVEENFGADFPKDGSKQEWVDAFKAMVFGGTDFEDPPSTLMESEGDNPWRYDLVFASGNSTAKGIIDDIMDKDDRKDVHDEIMKYRERSDTAQAGLEAYIRLGDEVDGENRSLFSF